GTSLSKGYGIIERFSEDVDILVVPPADATVRQKEARLLEMTEDVAQELGLEWEEHRPPGRGQVAHRADHVRYVPLIRAAVDVGIRPDSVLLEPGYSEGHEPSEMVTIHPLVAQAPGVNPADYDDTSDFTVRALQPRRTLVEKLFALHHVATQAAAGEFLEVGRFGRHYYDVYKLLDHRATRQLLENHREQFDHLVREVQRVSALHFGGTTARPEGGFATSPAFDQGDNEELRTWLRQQYDQALVLVQPGVRPPTFREVLRRVQQSAALL
ncbi:MAG TPA: nucleotidyl transferase AbiEii/AbiGii toxin family protein, partial [Chloroflexota bacterium]